MAISASMQAAVARRLALPNGIAPAGMDMSQAMGTKPVVKRLPELPSVKKTGIAGTPRADS